MQARKLLGPVLAIGLLVSASSLADGRDNYRHHDRHGEWRGDRDHRGSHERRHHHDHWRHRHHEAPRYHHRHHYYPRPHYYGYGPYYYPHRSYHAYPDRYADDFSGSFTVTVPLF
jgi:hypothetical protein